MKRARPSPRQFCGGIGDAGATGRSPLFLGMGPQIRRGGVDETRPCIAMERSKNPVAVTILSAFGGEWVERKVGARV
jgi:hypothetical protein